MKRILLSEEEKIHILAMHQNYKTKGIISEQSDMPQEDIVKLQNALNEFFKQKNMNLKLTPDGSWGKDSKDKMMIFQKANGLPETGLLDKATQDKMKQLGLNQDWFDKLRNAIKLIGGWFLPI